MSHAQDRWGGGERTCLVGLYLKRSEFSQYRNITTHRSWQKYHTTGKLCLWRTFCHLPSSLWSIQLPFCMHCSIFTGTLSSPENAQSTGNSNPLNGGSQVISDSQNQCRSQPALFISLKWKIKRFSIVRKNIYHNAINIIKDWEGGYFVYILCVHVFYRYCYKVEFSWFFLSFI